MEFQVALDIINNISDNCLYLYTNRTITVLRRFSKQLQYNFLATISYIYISPEYTPDILSPLSSPKSPQDCEKSGTLY